jgi:glycosyltransferase involved in cell wall biosynthesis
MYPVHLVAGLACRLRPTPCLWHWHGAFDPRGKMYNTARLSFRPLATRIACISRFVAESLPPSARQKACVVYNAVERVKLRAAQRPGALRALLSVPPARPLVAIFGALTDYKGHEYFIRAAAAVLKQLPDTYFAIVGGETAVQRHRFGREARLRTLVQDLGISARVLFAGHVDDAALHMSDCDIVCLPTIPLGIVGEGFGLALAEAMAVGVPVIATSCGAAPEIVEDGVSGLLVPPFDAPPAPERGRAPGDGGSRPAAHRRPF